MQPEGGHRCIAHDAPAPVTVTPSFFQLLVDLGTGGVEAAELRLPAAGLHRRRVARPLVVHDDELVTLDVGPLHVHARQQSVLAARVQRRLHVSRPGCALERRCCVRGHLTERVVGASSGRGLAEKAVLALRRRHLHLGTGCIPLMLRRAGLVQVGLALQLLEEPLLVGQRICGLEAGRALPIGRIDIALERVRLLEHVRRSAALHERCLGPLAWLCRHRHGDFVVPNEDYLALSRMRDLPACLETSGGLHL